MVLYSPSKLLDNRQCLRENGRGVGPAGGVRHPPTLLNHAPGIGPIAGASPVSPKMKTRRRLFLLALCVAVVLLGVGIWLLWPRWPHTAISQENVNRINVGMTLAEVEQILGGPARDERRERALYVVPSKTIQPRGDCHEWIGQDCGVIGEVIPIEASMLDRFRRWLRL
jgi:hypothetical protein